MSQTDLRHDIESTREALGDTVEALAKKTDVKTRVKNRVAERKARFQDTVTERKGPLAAIAAVVALLTTVLVVLRLRRGDRR
jgi:hypothetical protein